MTVRDAGEFIIWTGAIAGALIAIITLARFAIVKPIISALERKFVPSLKAIQQEVTENEGKSMKDAIVRIEARIATLDKRFDDHVQLHTQAHE